MDSGRYQQSRYIVELNQNMVEPSDFKWFMLLFEPNAYCSDPDRFIRRAGSGDDAVNIISFNSIIHEITHLVHDYSLGSEMVRDTLFDQICGLALTQTKKQQSDFQTTVFPMKAQLEQDPVLGDLYNTYAGWYREIYEEPFLFRLIYNNGEKLEIPLTTDELLEAYAAARSYHYMTSLAGSYPELNRAYFNENMAEKYKNPWKIFRQYCAFERRGFDGAKKTPNLQYDINSFLLLCDIALHIPPLSFAEPIAQYDLPEYQIPCLRFLQALNTLHKNGGFPDAVDGVDFYVTLYDFISKDNQWPDFHQVQNMWSVFFYGRMAHIGLMTSDLYRFFATEYKLRRTRDIILGNIADIFYLYRIPMLLRFFDEESFSLEWVQFDRAPLIWDGDNSTDSLLGDPYRIMTTCYNPWTFDTLKSAIQENGYSNISSLPLIYLREIFCRNISKVFWCAALEEAFFQCPLIDLNCKDKVGMCVCIKNPSDLPQRCCLRNWLFDYMINPNQIKWGEKQ